MKTTILYFGVFCISTATVLLLLSAQFKYSPVANSIQGDAFCDVVHLCIVCWSNSCDRINFYTMLKSIYFYHNHPLYFHVLVDDLSERFTEVLFDTWSVSQVSLNTYNVKKLPKELRGAVLKNYNSMIMALPELLSSYTTKVILINPEIFIEGDVYNIWKLFHKFKENQLVAIVKPNDTSVVLVDLEKLSKFKASTAKYTSKVNLVLDLNQNVTAKNVQWNRINDIQEGKNTSITLQTLKAVSNVMNALPPKLVKCGGVFPEIYTDEDVIPQCRQYPERNYKRKTLLYVRKFTYTPKPNDVTLLTHLTYSKLELLEEISARWKGPISAAIYLSENELDKCLAFIQTSETLKNRYDIGYHVVFSLGRFYPINVIRNVALRNVLTEYVFLVDVDFLPMMNLQDVVKEHIGKMKTMNKKALVVPAFSSYIPNATIPKTKDEWIKQWDHKFLYQFKHKHFPMGHRPTNYTKLRNATKPYVVKWEAKYEPYIIVQANVTEYDERFFAYGQNKISHILTLVVQNYEFVVLPNTFVIHKFHKPFGDTNYFLKIKSYMFCLDTLIYEHTKQLNNKYGRNFKYEDFLF